MHEVLVIGGRRGCAIAQEAAARTLGAASAHSRQNLATSWSGPGELRGGRQISEIS